MIATDLLTNYLPIVVFLAIATGLSLLMVLASLGSFYLNTFIATARYGGKKEFNWESPLTDLVWITSIVSIIVCFIASKFLLGDFMIPSIRNDGLGLFALFYVQWILLGLMVSIGALERGQQAAAVGLLEVAVGELVA